MSPVEQREWYHVDDFTGRCDGVRRSLFGERHTINEKRCDDVQDSYTKSAHSPQALQAFGVCVLWRTNSVLVPSTSARETTYTNRNNPTAVKKSRHAQGSDTCDRSERTQFRSLAGAIQLPPAYRIILASATVSFLQPKPIVCSSSSRTGTEHEQRHQLHFKNWNLWLRMRPAARLCMHERLRMSSLSAWAQSGRTRICTLAFLKLLQRQVAPKNHCYINMCPNRT